jgi:MFS family permease
MDQAKMILSQEPPETKRRAALGLWAIFITQFVSFLFINARNIAQPGMVSEFDGMALFAWLIALPALSGATATLLFGKLSDMYGRRRILLIAMAIFGLGLSLVARSTSMAFLVSATTFMSIGHWPIVPLCFSAIGDLFPPAERAKWTGLLNIPTGIAALIGPTLGGAISESALGWRALYWGTIPLLLIAGGLVVAALPKEGPPAKSKVDLWGTVVMVIATTTLIFGFSWLGASGKFWAGIILLLTSTAAWIGFIQIEKRAEAPILDPQVLFNRVFITAAGTGLLSFFGSLGIGAYSPIFAQDVMKVNPAVSGSMLTPYTVIVALMGIAAGFLLARTKKYKWIYKISYIMVTLAMFVMWQFTAETPIWLYMLVTSLAGFGLGAIPTMNTLVAQYATPKHLLGVAVGAIFFFQMVGISVAPAILGLAQNSASDLEGGLTLVFLVGAIAMLIASFFILTIPEVSIDAEAAE